MGILTVSTSKGKTLRSLINATKSGTGTLVSDGNGGVALGSSVAAPSYADYGSLPVSETVGSIASVPRLCGHGYFLVMWNGTRWAVMTGQAIISDAGPGSSTSGYDLTATGTSFVSLAAYTIPAGMIGDGEEWGAGCLMKNNGVWNGGADAIFVRAQALTTNGVLATGSANGSANKVVRSEGRFARLGTTITRHTAGITYSNQSSNDQTLDLSVAQIFEAGIAPGAIGNTVRVRQWAMWRCS